MSVLKEKIIKEDGTTKWKPVSLPPSGDTLPIGSILEISDDMEIPYGYELISNEWINATLLNNVVAVEMGGSSTPQFKKDGNTVFIRGAVKVTWDGSTEIKLFNLPEKYRPSNNVFVYVPSAEKTIARLYIASNGNVIVDTIMNISNGSKYTNEAWIDIHTSFEL